MDIGPTIAKIPPGGRGSIFFKNQSKTILCNETMFLGKIRVKKFSTGPQLSEYVQVVCRNKNGTCLKSVSKTPTFRFFRDSQHLRRLLHTSSQMANFGQFLAKMGEKGFFFKKAFGTFFSLFKALINCKVSLKVMKGFGEKWENLHFWVFWSKMTNFGPFLTKMDETGFFFKKALGTFFSRLQAPTV